MKAHEPRLLPDCSFSEGPQLTGGRAGPISLGVLVSEVRSKCNVIADTTLNLEGQPWPAILIALATDTILAEIVAERISRITVRTGGLRTAASLGVGSSAPQMLKEPGARLVTGETGYFIFSPSNCGLSFGVDLPPTLRPPWRTADVLQMSDSVRITEILVTKCDTRPIRSVD